MCQAECLFCPCCRVPQQRVIVRDCKVKLCLGVARYNIPGVYCGRCKSVYCREIGLLCCSKEWVKEEFDATPRHQRCVVKVKSLATVFELEALRLGELYKR